MNLPDVVHPQRFRAGDTLIEVATYFPVTEREARLIAMQFVRSIRLTRKHKGKVLRTHWAGDRESIALLEPQQPPGW